MLDKFQHSHPEPFLVIVLWALAKLGGGPSALGEEFFRAWAASALSLGEFQQQNKVKVLHLLGELHVGPAVLGEDFFRTWAGKYRGGDDDAVTPRVSPRRSFPDWNVCEHSCCDLFLLFLIETPNEN